MRLKMGLWPLGWLGVSLLVGCATSGGPEAMRQTLPVANVPQVQAEGTDGPRPATQPARLQLNVQGKTLTETDLPGFLVQGFKDKDERDKAFSQRVKDWYNKPRDPECKRTPELLISEVKLTETGVSVFGKEAPGSIQPDLAGKSVGLTLRGTFKVDRKDLQIKNFRFTLEPPLVQQTFVGKEPKDRVLLDDSILLEPVSVSGSEIKVLLRTEQVPDLYLKGLHKISIEHESWFTDALVQVSEPAPVVDLKPQIDSVEVLRDKRNKPQNVRCTGKHFMVFPKFSYSLIDGEFGFDFQTEVTFDGQYQTIINIPHPDTFDPQKQHSLMMATPFGIAIKVF